MRGFRIGFGIFEDDEEMFANARFLFSLREKPVFFPNGATLFLNEQTFAMVLEHQSKFIEFCALFKCFDYARFTGEVSLCHFPSQHRKIPTCNQIL